MKKFTAILVTMIVAIAFAVPVMALETKFSGYYRVRGFSSKFLDLQDRTGKDAAESYMNMRLQINTEFKVNDDAKINTRVRALNNMPFGDINDYSNTPIASNGYKFQFDRAWMTFKTPIGGFLAGRMSGGEWGTWFGNDEDSADRLIYVLPIDNLTFGLTYEKAAEADGYKGRATPVTATYAGSTPIVPDAVASKDNDKYYLSGTYKDGDTEGGLLFSFYNYKLLPDMEGYLADGKAYALTPYFKAKFGITSIEGELCYVVGKGQYDTGNQYLTGIKTTGYTTVYNGTYPTAYNAAYAGAIAKGMTAAQATAFATTTATTTAKTMATNYVGSWVDAYAKRKELDLSLFSYYLQASFDLNPVTVKTGYAFVGGDADQTDSNVEAATYISPGGDFAPLYILTGYDVNTPVYARFASNMGNLGNALSNKQVHAADVLGRRSATAKDSLGNPIGGSNRSTVTDGYRLSYLGADFKAMDNLTLGIVVGMSSADETDPGWSKKHGEEYDLNVNWKIMDNLTYKFTYAYLSAGEYWQFGNSKLDIPNPYVFFNELRLNF